MNLEGNARELGKVFFKLNSIYTSKDQKQETRETVKKARNEWSRFQKTKKKDASDRFYETQRELTKNLKQIEKRLRAKKCRREALQKMLPAIRKQFPDLLKNGGTYQLYMARVYLKGFLRDQGDYPEMLYDRLIHKEVAKKEKEKLTKILIDQISVLVKIVLHLLETYEKYHN
jgi:intein/homing endonuclease